MSVEGDLLDSAQAGTVAIRGGVIRVGGYILGALLSLVSAAVLFRYLGVKDAGRYVTVQSIVVVAAGITDGGLTAIGMREYATLGGADRERVLRDLLAMRLVLTVLGMLGAVAFAALAGYGSTLVLGTVITAVGLILTAMQHQFGVGLTAQLRQGWVSAADIVRQAVQAIVIVALVVAGASLLDMFWASVVGCAAAVAVIVVVARGSIPLLPAWRPSRWGSLLGDTLVFSVAAAVGAIYFRLAIVLVSLIDSAQQTGYYSAAFRGVEVLFAIPGLLVITAFPILSRAARDDRERLAYAVGKITDVSIVLGAGVALALAVGAPFIIDVVAGSDFDPAAAVLRVQGLGLFFSFVGAGWGFAALSLRRHRAVLVSNLVALACCATLVPVLTSAHHAVGAAVATTLCEAVLAASLAISVARAGVPVRVDLPGLARLIAALLVALIPVAIPGLPDVARLLACTALFAAGVLLLRALPDELRTYLPGRLR